MAAYKDYQKYSSGFDLALAWTYDATAVGVGIGVAAYFPSLAIVNSMLVGGAIDYSLYYIKYNTLATDEEKTHAERGGQK